MQGEAEEARHLIDRSLAIHEELGLTFRRAVTLGFFSAGAHKMAGDLVAAERDLRLAIELLEATGDKGVRSTVTAFLAGTLYALGRYSEAERQVDLAEQLAGTDDWVSHSGLGSLRAKILALHGELERAKEAAEEAIRIAEASDDIDSRGCLWMDKAEVLSLAGDPMGAASCLELAIDLLEQKGNVVTAGKARARLGELQKVGPVSRWRSHLRRGWTCSRRSTRRRRRDVWPLPSSARLRAFPLRATVTACDSPCDSDVCKTGARRHETLAPRRTFSRASAIDLDQALSFPA